jgi:hypothetical protein
MVSFPLVSQWSKIAINHTGYSKIEMKESSDNNVSYLWGVLPYTLFVYSIGFSLGPSVAELHTNRRVDSLFHSLPIIALISIIFGILLVVGAYAMYKQFDFKVFIFCLFGLLDPLMSVAIISFMTQFTPNVRYTIIAFPYFCILLGTAVAFIWYKNRQCGLVTLCILLTLCIISLNNHFFHPRYAKEDIRAAVAFWRSVSTHEYLLSCSTAGGVRDAIDRYLIDSERTKHFPIGGNRQFIEAINEFFSIYNVSAAYIIIARDWNKEREISIRKAFYVDRTQHYPGLMILRIFRN